MTHRLPQAASGYILIEPINEETDIKLSGELKGRMRLGKVISCGETVITDFGAKVPCPCKDGDVVYFQEYESDYDAGYIGGKRYIFALFRDVRGIQK